MSRVVLALIDTLPEIERRKDDIGAGTPEGDTT